MSVKRVVNDCRKDEIYFSNKSLLRTGGSINRPYANNVTYNVNFSFE